MDESPEPTMVLKTLKDFNKFISSGSKSRESTLMSGSSRLKLNFTDLGSDCSSILEESRDTTINPRKRQLENTLTGLDVTKRFREKDTELAEAKSTITMLEGRLQNVEMSNKKSRVLAETELENLKRKQSRDKELIDDLQHKIKHLQKIQKDAQEEARKVKQVCNTSTHEAETKLLNMQRENMEQNNTLREEVAFLQQRVLDLETEVEERTIEVENTQCHTDELLEELETAQQKLRELTASQLHVETVELQLEQAKSKIKDLEMQRDELTEVERKNNVFESTMAKLYKLEKRNVKLEEENKFLKDTAMNTQLLEEKLTNAKQQIMLLESRCKDIAQQEAKAELFKNNLKTFEDAIMEELVLSERPTVQELKSHIAKLKKEELQRTTGIEELCASQKGIKSKQVQQENENKALRSKLEKQHTVIQQNVQIIKRLQRKLLLLTQDRDSLKKILTTYEAELTINYSIVSQERIEKLESQLQCYRDELKLMEDELEESYKSAVEGTETPKKRDRSERVLSMEKQVSSMEKVVSSKEKLVSELEETVKKLNDANATLTLANEVLEGRIENLTLKGDYDPTTTKVLHFKNNPLSAAIENRETQLETLQTENRALRERVRLLEEGEQLDLTQKVGMKVSTEGHQSNKDVLSLQEEISSMETRNKRLMELFKKKSLEMREAIYLLTGYRVDSTTDNHYKLTNMYAESADDFFMFELAPNGELQLLETAFSETLEGYMEVYLQRKNSFPAFLSAVTLDLFRKQSLSSPISGVEDDIDDEDEDDMEEEMHERKERSQMPSMQRDCASDDIHEEEEEEAEEEEEDEEELEEEEEENDDGEEEGMEDEGDDLICID